MATLISNKTTPSLVLASPGCLSFSSLQESDNEDHRIHLKKSVCKKLLRLFATDKLLIACFQRILVIISLESKEVLAAEPLTSAYDCVLLDYKHIAVSCKAADQSVIITYSLDSLAPISVCSLPIACRFLIPLMTG